MRIRSAELLSNDLKATADFYRSRLGFAVRAADNTALTLEAGRSQLVFRHTATHRPVYHVAFSIPFRQVDAGVSALSRDLQIIPHEGHEIVEFDAWNARAFYFYDNNGNILEMIGRADLADDSGDAEGFSKQPVSALSEVAVVSDHLREIFEEIRSATGIQRYIKQPWQDHFAAMGDAEGLIILSTPNRHWFPTEVPAMKFPVKIEIEHLGKTFSLAYNF